MAAAALVVDASALVDALLINGAARACLSEASLHAPELIDAELLSVLRRLVLTGQLAEQQALLALDTAQLLGLRRHTTRQLWPFASSVVASPLALIVCWALRIVAVGLNATRITIGSPLLMPP